MSKKVYDVAVVGGGASGLAAAVSAVRMGADTVIIERNARIGKKLLLTGNGRCNLSHTHIDKNAYYGDNERAVEIIGAWQGSKAFFESLGLYVYTDDEGRIYPKSNTASSVLDAFRIALADTDILCDFTVDGIIYKDKEFHISSPTGTIASKRVIIAGGGFSAPDTGSDGSGIRLLKSYGHKCALPTPALCPLKTDADNIKPLKGLRLRSRVTLFIDGKEAAVREGEVQFTESSLSGICVFDISRIATAAFEDKKSSYISINALPDMTESEITDKLTNIRAVRKNAPLEDMLSGFVNKRLGMYIMKKCVNRPLSSLISSLSDGELSSLSEALTDLRFDITGVSSWKNSQVTAGGIYLNEFGNGLNSLRQNGLYACGEALNVDGICGGYNLEWAWASGCTAGISAAQSLSSEEK